MTLLLLSLILPDAEANNAGITGQSQSGCTCHGASADNTTTTTLSPASTTVVPGDSLLVNFVVSTTSGSRTAAGLNVSASGGTLAAGSNTRLTNSQITQSSRQSMTAGSVTFALSWTAPTTEGTYTIYGAGNAVNANNGSSGDGWNRTSVVITVDDGCNDSDGDGYTTGCGDLNDGDATIFPH